MQAQYQACQAGRVAVFIDIYCTDISPYGSLAHWLLFLPLFPQLAQAPDGKRPPSTALMPQWLQKSSTVRRSTTAAPRGGADRTPPGRPPPGRPPPPALLRCGSGYAGGPSSGCRPRCCGGGYCGGSAPGERTAAGHRAACGRYLGDERFHRLHRPASPSARRAGFSCRRARSACHRGPSSSTGSWFGGA